MKKGKFRATARGANYAAFICAVNNAGIALYKLKRDGCELSFVCDIGCEAHVARIAARHGMLFRVCVSKNEKTSLRAFLKHTGAWTALACVVISFAVSRFFVFSVAVEGVSSSRAAEIYSAISEAGIDGVTAKSAIDLQKVEELVAGSSDDIAFAEAYIDGIRLVVNVREQIPQPVAEESDGEIVSSSDAIVTRVEVSGGTAVVKEGDTVRKGQTLIEDYILVGDPLDPEHKEIETAAEGDVYGRVWYVQRLNVPTVVEKTVRTGRKYSSSELLFNDKVLLSAKSDHGFGEWELECLSKPLGSVLPLSLNTYTWYETVTERVEVDEAYLEGEIYAAFSSLFASLDPSATVLESYKSQKKVDNYYIIILYYEVEQLIGCREA